MSCRSEGVRIGYGKAGRIAKDPAIPGKFEYGHCATFAHALHARFREAGIPSRIITFGYEATPEARPILGSEFAFRSGKEVFPRSGVHAMVVYEDDGRTYAMDNQTWMPKWIRAGSPREIAEQVAGLDARVLAAR